MLKTLGAQVKEFKLPSILTPMFMILEVIMEMVVPLLMASIIDDGVEKGNIRHICLVGLGMVLAALVGLFAGIMGGKYGAGRPRDLPEISGGPCMKISRHFPFPTSTNTVRRD